MEKASSVGTRSQSNIPWRIARALIVGTTTFTICVFTFPLLLLKFDAPENYIAATAVIIVAVSSFAGAFAATKGNNKSFFIPGILCSLSVILILVTASLIFSNNDGNKNYLYSGILYSVGTAFSMLGAKFSSSLGKKKKKRR